MELYEDRTPQSRGAMTVEYFSGTMYFIWVNVTSIRNTTLLVSHVIFIFPSGITTPFKSQSFQPARAGPSHVSTRWVDAEQSRQGGIAG